MRLRKGVTAVGERGFKGFYFLIPCGKLPVLRGELAFLGRQRILERGIVGFGKFQFPLKVFSTCS